MAPKGETKRRNSALRCRGAKAQKKSVVCQLKSRKGRRIPAALRSAPITWTTRNGAPLYQAGIMNLSERKRAEKALDKSGEHLRAIINQSNAGIASCDLSGRFLFANQKFREMLGYTDSELAVRTIFTITHPDDVGITKSRFGQMLQTRQPIEIEKRYMRKDDSLVWVNVCDTPVLNAAGKPISAVAVAVDVTQRKEAEAALQTSKKLLEKLVQQRTKALRAANKELQCEISRRKGLEGQILEISDREQQRLGQELHDGLCQHLTAVAFMTRGVALRLKNHRVIEVKDLEKIAELVNEAAVDARNMARGLHRLVIDSASLLPALRDLVSREIWKTPCRLDVKTEVNLHDDEVASHVYQLLREAVINAHKHAQAKEIVVEIRQSNSDTVFSVNDDGVGLPGGTSNSDGLGFQIMNYRARTIGASLKVKSRKSGGTRIACYLPEKALKSHKKENARSRLFPRKSRKHWPC